jgi:hypothetical protein
MILLAAALASLATCVPVRWPSADPATLALLAGTPINCLVQEPAHWSPAFSAAAREKGIATVGLTRAPHDPKSAAHLLAVVPLADRSSLDFANAPVLATDQGLWPGINPPPEGQEAKAAPSGAPWIDTNAGFLRFARTLTAKPIWIANAPPPGKAFPIARYLQAAAEAAMCGARWVVSLDADFQRRLFSNDANALRDWRRLAATLAFIEERRDDLAWPPSGQLTLVQNKETGALLSGGILDMIAVKHTPVRPVPADRISLDQFRGAVMAVNVDPAAMTPAQRDVLAAFARAGGTVLTGPPGWRFPSPRPGQLTLAEKELEKLDSIWKEVNALTGRRNLGARLFNVGSMLSNLTQSPDGKRRQLHLVNYTDFNVEAITVHMLGKWTRARLLQPGVPPKILETYPTEDGTGIDIPEMATYAILEVE